MPLHSITSEEALSNIKRNRRSAWPDGRRETSRLEGVATVQFDPSFTLQNGEAVLTVGSCFARNIEKRLAAVGFDVPATRISLPAEERASDTENDILNKYTPHSILNEFRWAFDPAFPFPEESYLEVKDGWQDPHQAPNVAPATLERVRERRAMVQDLYRELPRCGVVVVTLGLLEAWYDEKTGLYLNGQPPGPAMRREPNRFRLDVLKAGEVVEVLDQLHTLLLKHGPANLRMLITVSPVPMRATFTGKDAIAANCYSKSAQRAAAEEFVSGRTNVDYFPSYEIVTQTLRSQAFMEDNRHVSPSLVQTIANRVVSAYCDTPPAEVEEGVDPDDSRVVGSLGVLNAKEAAVQIKAAMQKGRHADVVKLFASLEPNRRFERANFTEFSYRFEYGKALLRINEPLSAEFEFEKARVVQPDSPMAYFGLGIARGQLERPREAEEAFRRAVELAPDVESYRVRLARQLIRNDKCAEAEEHISKLLEKSPDNDSLKNLLQLARETEAAAEVEADPTDAGGSLWSRVAKRLTS